MSSIIYQFPQRLRALREEIGLSQTEFAEAFGISRASLSYYETGSRTPDIQFLQSLHEKTGCSIDYLLGYVDNMKPDNELLGLIAGLSDKAIDKLEKLELYSDTTNALIEHENFEDFVRTLDAMRYEDSTQKSVFNSSLFEYMLFRIMGLLRQISMDTRTSLEQVRIFSVEHEEAFAEIDSDNFKRRRAIQEMVIAARDEDRKRFEEDEARQDELAKTNPLLRFYRRMVKSSPKNDVITEGRGEDGQ